MAWYNKGPNEGLLSAAGNSQARAGQFQGQAAQSIGKYGESLIEQADKRRADERANAMLELQKSADRRAQDELKIRQAVESRAVAKAKQDELAGLALAGLGGIKDITNSVLVPGNKEQVNNMIDLNKRIEAKNAENLAKATDTGAFRQFDLAQQKVDNDAAIENAINKFDTVLKNTNQLNEERIAKGQVLGIPEDKIELAPTDQILQAKTKLEERLAAGSPKDQSTLLKEAGIEAPKVIPLEKVPELVKDSTKTTTTKESKQDWLKRAYESIAQNKDLTGTSKGALLSGLKTQADTLFGPDKKPLSVSDQLKMFGISSKNKSEKAQISDMKGLISGQGYKPKSSTLEGLKKEYDGILKKKGKSSDSLQSALEGVTTDEPFWQINDEREDAMTAANEVKGKYSEEKIAQAIRVATDEGKQFNKDKFQAYLGIK